jgi:hypothetical protein
VRLSIRLGLLAPLLVATTAGADEPRAPVHPIKVSANGRYFVDREGTPVFWLGTTQWELFRGYTREDARTILDKSRDKGFAFVQVILTGLGDGTRPNVYGDEPWTDDDPRTPNEAYFRNVDAAVRAARERGLALSVAVYHQAASGRLTADNARGWARWVARRYRDEPNLVWSLVPEAKPDFVPVLRELAAGLREGDGGRHLITVEPDPAPHSSGFLHAEEWLDFHSVQTWASVDRVYSLVTQDYDRRPAKPVLMAEGAYEAGSEYGFEVTPLWVRRQAYYSYLAGGHHAYGHNDSWRVLPTWREALDAPGAAQLAVLKGVFQGRAEWWRLVPDQSVFASGGTTSGRVLSLAARHEDGRWAIVYLGGPCSFSVALSKVAAAKGVLASWVDPRDGREVPLGILPGAGERGFSTPQGWPDALLILERPGG